MTFSRAFTPTSLCSPARASLLTGLMSHQHTMTNLTNVRIPSVTDLPGHVLSFARLLREAGYRTGYVGKWHSGVEKTPPHWGFEDYLPGEGWHEWWPEGVELEDPSAVRLGYDHSKPMAARVPRPLAEYPDCGRTDAAIGLLERYAADGAPFCCQLNYFGPHYPHYLPEPYHSIYDPRQIPQWENFDSRPTTPHAGYRWLRQRWGAPSDDWSHYARIVAAQYGQVTLLEHEIQRVLNALDRLGLAESTMVIFTADHGELAGAHGLLQKGAVAYDELYHLPLIARWPGTIEAGSACDEMVSLIDLMPTMLEVGGVPRPPDGPARSIVPLMTGQTPVDWPQEVFCEYLAHQAGDMELKILRTKTHKLAVNLSDRDELFDLVDDPQERENRIDDSAHAGVRSQLATRLLNHMRQTEDPLTETFSRRLAPYEPAPSSTASRRAK